MGKSTVAGLVAKWIRCLTMDQKIPGSNPGRLVTFLAKNCMERLYFSNLRGSYVGFEQLLFIYIFPFLIQLYLCRSVIAGEQFRIKYDILLRHDVHYITIH